MNENEQIPKLIDGKKSQNKSMKQRLKEQFKNSIKGLTL
jgi:hypothetical protein